MSSSNGKPWWMRISEIESLSEREEFIRGIAGFKTNKNRQSILMGLVAGYIGGKVAQKQGKK
jgi:hypothetical protein